MSLFYVDTSVAAQILLGHSPSAARWFDQTRASDDNLLASSRLLQTELTRVLRRVGQPVVLRHEVLDYIGEIPLDHAVLQGAEAIVPHVKTLDAIHLASALLRGPDGVTVCTHDRAMQRVAHELGLATLDPVDDSTDLVH